jgi:hypothetical protein
MSAQPLRSPLDERGTTSGETTGRRRHSTWLLLAAFIGFLAGCDAKTRPAAATLDASSPSDLVQQDAASDPGSTDAVPPDAGSMGAVPPKPAPIDAATGDRDSGSPRDAATVAPAREAGSVELLAEDVPVLDPAVPFPETLREVGIYPLGNDLARPVERAVPYRPRSELWSNGLGKQRLLLLPRDARIDTTSEPWQFPPGTLFVKTFSDLNGPVETRFLRQVGDGFEYATYQWQADGEATLLEGRLNVDLTVTTEEGATPHTIPSRLTCRQCHESSNTQVLGFSSLQLWSAELGADPGLVFDVPREFEDPIRESDPTSRAVLDYFVGNCVHCHNDGVGLASSFDLRPNVAFANVIEQPTDSNATAAGIRVVRRSPEESILFRAVSGEGDTEEVKNMPPEGVQFRDSEAVELLRTWIVGL